MPSSCEHAPFRLGPWDFTQLFGSPVSAIRRGWCKPAAGFGFRRLYSRHNPSRMAVHTFNLDHAHHSLYDARGRRFNPATRTWDATASVDTHETIDVFAAALWLQRESGHPLRVPIGVIGPREANDAQLAAAREVGELLARCGFAVLCGGRTGVMEATCDGVKRGGGTSIGLIGDPEPELANPHASVILATGIGEARNAIIARASFCLVCIGASFGTLSEVALGRQFGKPVVGLEGAPQVDGVVHATSPREAVSIVANLALGRAA